MIPEHCKEVSLRSVDFPLTEKDILSSAVKHKAYTRTRYLVLNNGSEYAVIKIEKEPGIELFRKIASVEIISLPENTVFIEDENVDVLNLSALAEIGEEHSGKTVVVRGEFGHLSFVKDEKSVEIEVIEVVPPFPPKLVKLAEKSIALNQFERAIRIVPKIIDIRKIISECEGTVVLPCRASGISEYCSNSVIYLDEAPGIPNDGPVTLIGCDLSLRIFSSLYRSEPEFHNICPAEFIRDSEKEDRPVLLKCCKVKEGVNKRGRTAEVPWGATLQEVSDALRYIISVE